MDVKEGFDRFATTYEADIERSIAFAGQEHAFYVEAKALRLLELARKRLGPARRPAALDVGSGVGLAAQYVLPHVSSLHGVDVSEAMVEQARAANPQATYEVYDGRRLPYDDGTFDLAFVICVLHHVAATERAPLLAETARVTRHDGLVAVFEHNPLNPLTRRVIRACPWDEDIELLGRREVERHFRAAGLQVLDVEYLLFFPSRRRVLAAAEGALRRIPLGAQYVVAGRPRR